MFVVSVKSKIKKPKRMLIIAALGIILLGVIFCTAGNTRPKNEAKCEAVGTYSLSFGNEGERADFLEVFGIEGELITVDKVKIPSEFNKIYEKYNGIQKKMGLNLDGYKGETVTRFVYKTEDEMYVSVLCSNNTVVACHKCTNIYGDDFMALI